MDNNIERYSEQLNNLHYFDMDLEDLNKEIFDSFSALSKLIEYEHGLVVVGAGVGQGQRIQAQFC